MTTFLNKYLVFILLGVSFILSCVISYYTPFGYWGVIPFAAVFGGVLAYAIFRK